MNIATFRNIGWSKKSGVLIIAICLSAVLLKYLAQPYRGTWVYQYGSLASLLAFYGSVFWSLINTILLISKHRSDFRKNLIWVFFSAIPFLYIVTMITISITKTIE